MGLLYTMWTNTTWTLACGHKLFMTTVAVPVEFNPPPGQSFWLNCSVHQLSHMRYSLSDLTGQSNGKDVPRTFSRGSPDSGEQLTVSNCHVWSLPQPGTYHLGQEGQRGSRCTKHIFSQNTLCLTTYTSIFMQKEQMCEWPQNDACCQLWTAE